jgi:hypothetical protein
MSSRAVTDKSNARSQISHRLVIAFTFTLQQLRKSYATAISAAGL